MSVYTLYSNVTYFSQALQEARVKTTDTLVAMEEEDDFEDPLTPTAIKGMEDNLGNCIFYYVTNLKSNCFIEQRKENSCILSVT